MAEFVLYSNAGESDRDGQSQGGEDATDRFSDSLMDDEGLAPLASLPAEDNHEVKKKIHLTTLDTRNIHDRWVNASASVRAVRLAETLPRASRPVAATPT